ncbi:MAG: asparaginase domain-containing protein [Synergistes jonesii]|uniref:asparaginase domain-containing protein n=1 Tax=Synergistes jonesii TaxID=2754 RepID=UPI002A7594D5|nr:asparaginase domain-containing protein [Synergistes jonesii]MDY2984530.1 asparaginase domain-containing protein [Synergistes jonesii]
MLPQTKLALVIAGNFFSDEDNADPGLLLGYLPEELAARCEIKEWSTQPSSHYSMSMTLAMEGMFESLADEGYAGIIVVSGSGVMEEMAYLVNLLWQHEAPVIFANLMVQGRAGVKEGLMNLHCSVLAALSDDARGRGVLLCSSGELFAADDVTLADPGSPDNAFQSPDRGSVGKMLNGEIKFFCEAKRPSFLARRPEELPNVEIMLACLGGGDILISSLASSRDLGGLVLAGFGAGNVPPSWVPTVRNILRRRIPVVITSRCLLSHVHKTNDFEGSFDKLTEMGVMSGGRLNPYKARIRLALGISAGLTDDGLSLYLLGRPVCDDVKPLYK